MTIDTSYAGESSKIRASLFCGIICGPLYVALTLTQALTRNGFDITRHRFTLLTIGELGWVHRWNMVFVGALTVLFAIGAGKLLQGCRGAVWVTGLLTLFGLAYVVGGMLTADSVLGFPPGADAEMLRTTLQGKVQNLSRGASTLLLFAASLAFARLLAAEGRRGLAWAFGMGIPATFAALATIGFVMGIQSGGLAFLMTPWIWVTAMAVHLSQRTTNHIYD
jgi:Protein of unknown function (DUF998)